MRKKIPNTPIEYSRVRPSWKNVLSRKAIYKYTSTWNKNIRALSGEFPIDKNREKRAKLWKKYISREFRIQNFNQPLYRGIQGKNKNNFMKSNVVKKPSFSSFSKSKNRARSFGNYVLILNNTKRVPSINFRNYHSVTPYEKEVLLPGGTFTVTKRNSRNIHVKFQPNISLI